ncbi:MAG: DUF4383 domain-containing protein [Rubrobacteraceae bacterium]|nr:DUF4383 domain-containing protein [Rubrobacteraceae bacterium]
MRCGVPALFVCTSVDKYRRGGKDVASICADTGRGSAPGRRSGAAGRRATGPRLLNADILEDIVHLITGGLLAYVGFGRTDPGLARNVVLVLGVIYLVVGLLGFVVPTLYGLLPDGYTMFDNLLHLALGVASIAVALFGRGSVATRG